MKNAIRHLNPYTLSKSDRLDNIWIFCHPRPQPRNIWPCESADKALSKRGEKQRGRRSFFSPCLSLYYQVIWLVNCPREPIALLRVALLHFCLEDYTIELANGLSKYVDLTLIHPEKISSYCRSLLAPRVNVRSFFKPRVRDWRNIASMREMMRIIREIAPDVLHVQETKDPWYDLTVWLNSLPPLVTTVHDAIPHPGDRNMAPGVRYTRRLSLGKSRRVIVHARSQYEALQQGLGVPGRRIEILPHGELGGLYTRGMSVESVPREPKTLLFYGRIWPYKGLAYLLKAMTLVAREIPDVKLIVAGKGENLDRYFGDRPDLDRYEIHNRFIPYEEVAGLFQRCSIVVLPYLEASQSGVAALAYGMNRPAIASDIGGLGEMIEHERDSLLVPPKDAPALARAIVRLLTDEELYGRIQAAQTIRCQNDLNWSNIADKTVDIYEKILEKNMDS
jgi:glycosyltransferase involved in cell wall biosynthesis